MPLKKEVAIFSKTGRAPVWDLPIQDRLFLVFGSETRGLPESIYTQYQASSFHIPTTKDVRSLNLSTAVGIALYESLRPYKPAHDWI